jgi:hypothetical protein
MPIISSFTGVAARGFGFTNGLPPLPPTDISFATSELNAVVTFTTTPTSYPVDIVQAKIMQGATLISDWATVTSGGNISASNLTPALSYTVYFRTRDTGGQISQEVSQTFTTIVETPPGAPTFSLAVASSDAGTFKFNITSTGGTAGTYSRITQYRIETSAGAQLLDWTTISSNSGTVTAYGADTYNGTGALSPATTYRVRLKTVADTSGTITYSSPAYQEVTTNGIVAPNAPTSLTAAVVATDNQGEFSFTFSHTPGTARSYPVLSSQYRVRSNNSGTITYVTGYDTYQDFVGTKAIGTSSYVDAILTPGSTYYIDTRTKDTQGTLSDVTSTSVTLTAKRNPTAGSVTVAAPTYNGTNTATLDVTPSGFTAGSWPISYYQYNFNNGDTYTTLSGNSVGGRTADTSYTVYVRAVDTQGYASAKVSGTAITNAALPPTPTIAWRSMTGASSGTAQFTISGNAGSTTTVKIARRTTSGSDTGATFVTKATGSQDIAGYASDGGREYYVAYNYNKHGSQSTASNQISWKRPEKNQPWNSGYIQTSAIYFSTTANCTSEFSYTFGTVPSSDNTGGYIAVNQLSVDGVQQTSGSVNGCAFMQYTVANKTHLAWVSDSFHPDFTADIYGTSSTAGFSGSWPYLNGTFGTATTGTLSNWGGSNISGKYFQVRTTLGSRTAGCAVGCGSYDGTTLQTYRMKNFILSGIQTLSGTVYD